MIEHLPETNRDTSESSVERDERPPKGCIHFLIQAVEVGFA
jgi:hypothetical protein